METLAEINKIKKFFYLSKNRWKHFLRRTEKSLLREMKEQDLSNFWKYLGSFEIKRSEEEESKIFLYALSIFIMTVFIVSGNFLFTNDFHIHYKMSNAQAKEDATLEVKEENGLDSKVETVNEYKLKSQDMNCADDKSQKKTSTLCGKDDEEELQKIAEKEKIETQKIMIKRKPIIKAPGPYVFEKDSLGRKVCNKKNDNPGKSNQDKGKHMDMECCLDPDETPNPNCYYSSSKYGKYL